MATLTSLQNHRDALQNKHSSLDQIIDEKTKLHSDSLELTAMKKQKLMLKEKLIVIDQNINELIENNSL